MVFTTAQQRHQRMYEISGSPFMFADFRGYRLQYNLVDYWPDYLLPINVSKGMMVLYF